MCCVIYAERIQVTFINPGKHGEVFWDQVCDFMIAAAEDLQIDLEILYSERDHIKMYEFTEEVCLRKKKPQYLILVNEKQMAGKMLKKLEEHKITSFLLLNIFTKEQTKKHGIPRQKHKHWIGSLYPDQEKAGFDIAAALFRHSTQKITGPINIIGVTGDYITPAATQRKSGLERFVKKHQRITLQQIIHSHWQQSKSHRQLRGLLRRYPKTNIIWTANDPMALGAIQAVQEKKLIPGKDIYVGGLNWSKEALDKIVTGELTTSIGGHFMGGGWALVMLRDYHEGRDFRSQGLEQKIYMGVIDRNNIKEYLAYFADQNWSKINFR